MKKNICILLVLIAIVSFVSCENDDMVEPYTTGVIKFQYQKSTVINGSNTLADTTVSFNSRGFNPNEYDEYGYSNPSTPWVIMQRLNPNDVENRAIVFFSGTNLNLLTLPYKFEAGDFKMAQVNYVVSSTLLYDSSGLPYSTEDTYAGSTYSDNFELTVLSRENNRLKGIFSGEIVNQDGLVLNIKNGLFDIVIVER